MSKKVLILLMVALVSGLFAVQGMAQGKKLQYIGTKKCKMCHNSKKSGEAYKIWSASKHAKAYETLASEESKAIAKKMGIEDPQKSDKCLSCHVTGYGKAAEMFAKTFTMEEGVGCESCHGPGSKYKSMKVMKNIHAGKEKRADYGLVIPTEEQCKSCHNEKSPTFKSFDFAKFSAQIAHPIPK